MELFEYAAKEKLRFPYKGNATIEDLWDLPVGELDAIYKKLSAAKKTAEEESLLEKRSKEDEALLAKIDIVRYIFSRKQEEAQARKRKAETDERKRRLRELIASKEDEALSAQSIDDLKKMLADME